MAKLPDLARDPTLEAVDRAIEDAQDRRPRPYLGMSEIGRECERELWYSFRWATRIAFDAEALKRFADGYHGEDVQAERLRMVEGVVLHTHDENGRQFGFSDHSGHFKGHMDGAILGLLQAARTWHVWEHKQVDPKKQTRLEKLKRELGEKAALEAWDTTYFVQGQLYMHYSGMTRHYLTCSTPGGRHTTSVRTDYHAPTALRFIERARRIVASPEPPPRISEDPGFWQCGWCSHAPICHEGRAPEISCRTCAHSTPELDVEGGRWSCALLSKDLTQREQSLGCGEHRYIPALLPWPAVDANAEENWIQYESGCVNGPEPFGASSFEIREMLSDAGD